MADPTPYVGRALKRVEDPRLVKGIGTYTDDVRLPGMLHAAILRSPHAHARVVRIDAGAAKAIPGVVAVFTGADVNDSCGLVPCAASIPDLKAPAHTVLADDRVYFAGHAVAVARQAFDRGDVGAVGLHREHGARLHRLAVDQHGARAADAGFAADVRAGQAQGVAQEVNEQQTGLDDVIARRVVDPDADRNGHGTTSEGGHPTASSRRTQRGRISL